MPAKIPRDLTNEQAAPLTSGSRMIWLSGIGIVLLSVVRVFLYLGGWFTPNALAPARSADAFEGVDGIHSGFHCNHAKGVCFSGFFKSNSQGARPSKDAVFRTGRVHRHMSKYRQTQAMRSRKNFSHSDSKFINVKKPCSVASWQMTCMVFGDGN